MTSFWHRGYKPAPAHAHPLVKQLIIEMNKQRATFGDIAGRTNIGIDTMRFWQRRHMPRLDLFDAALNALDLELVIRPLGTRARDLKRIEQQAVERAFKREAS